MITLLESIGPAIWRATWQAAVLALLVVLLLRCFGERLAPRWRFLLWGVVVARLLLVVTPDTPWSVFNLIRWNSEVSTQSIADHPNDPTFTPIPYMPDATIGALEVPLEPPKFDAFEPERSEVALLVTTKTPIASADTTTGIAPSSDRLFDAVVITRILSSLWLACCLLLVLKLLLTALVLRRRLSACRPVTDHAVLELLETFRRRLGLKRTPALLVTPECLSPCIVGTWKPRIVLPESVVTESSTTRLGHVLAHELAHLVRGDLWTNWLLLTARILHWFNPVAWWAVREMQSHSSVERVGCRGDIRSRISFTAAA